VPGAQLMVQAAIPAAIAVGSSLVKGLGANAAAKANARAADQNAVAELNSGAAEEARIRDAARRAMGEQIGAQGASGFQLGTGTALDALAESQINATMDALNARRDAAGRARGHQVKAGQFRREGDNALLSMGFDVANSIVGKTDWASPRKAAG
jgi:hypothetical protein